MKRFLPILTLVLTQCASAQETHNEQHDKCEINNQKSANYYVMYYESGNQLYLDSALMCIDEVIGECEKNIGILALRKLSIMSIKQDYSNALEFIGTFDKELFSDLPYFQNLLRNRFNAMKSQAEEDFSLRDKYIKSCIEDISKYISMNKTKVDSLVGLPDLDNILKHPLGTALSQYFYYRSLISGFESIKVELIEKQKAEEWNEEFINYLISYLEEDFMVFDGI